MYSPIEKYVLISDDIEKNSLMCDNVNYDISECITESMQIRIRVVYLLLGDGI